MGFFTRLLEAFGFLKKPAKLIVIGLDNAGKTTLINHLKPEHSAAHEVVPTVGFQEETFEHGKIKFTCFDMSGAETYRTLWEKFYADIQGIIFVVDASDCIRMCIAKDELDALLAHPDLKKAKGGDNACPILVYANKMDLPSAMEPAEVGVMMGLTALSDRAWHIQGSNALSGDGVADGVKWLASQLNKPGSANAGSTASASKAGGAASKAMDSASTKGGSAAASGSKVGY